MLGLFYETMTYKLVFHACSSILDSSFYVYSAIMDSFVIVSLFIEKYDIS